MQDLYSSCNPRRLFRAAAEPRQNPEMAQNQHVQVHRLATAVSDQMSVASFFGCVPFYAKNRVWLVLGAGGVLNGDESRSGIVVDKHLVRFSAGAANAQIAQGRLLTGQGLFAGDGVPLAAIRDHGVGKFFPNLGTKRNGRFKVDFVFMELALFGEFSGQKLLCCSLCTLVSKDEFFPTRILHNVGSAG